MLCEPELVIAESELVYIYHKKYTRIVPVYRKVMAVMRIL